MTKTEITVTNRTVIRVMAVVIASLLFLAVVRQAAHALTLLAVAFFLALALNAPVQWFAGHLPGKGRNRALATGVSFLVVILVLGAFAASIVPPLVRQTGAFLDAVPGLIEDLRDERTGLGEIVHRYELESYIDDLSQEASKRVGSFSSTALNTASRVGSSLVSGLTVLALTFMMLVEGPRWIGLFKRLMPKKQHERTEHVLNAMYHVVRGYVNGQVLVAALAAIFVFPPLVILNISYPVALMVIVFICGLIPLVGNFIGAGIITLVALFTSPIAALAILTYFILYQQIDNYLIQPRIHASTTNMSPLLVFAAVVIGVSFNGLIGGLFAIPIAGCLRILILEYINNHHLLDQDSKAAKANEHS